MHPGQSKPNYSRLRMMEGYRSKSSVTKDTDINVNIAFRPFLGAGHWETIHGPEHVNTVGEDDEDQSERENDKGQSKREDEDKSDTKVTMEIMNDVAESIDEMMKVLLFPKIT